MNQYFALSGFFNALVTFFLAFYIYLRNKRSTLHKSFTFFLLTVAFWCTFYALWQIQTTKSSALFFMRMAMLPCYYIPFSFLWFVLSLVEYPKRRIFSPFCLAAPSFFSFFGFSVLNVKDVVPRLYFPFWPIPGFLMDIYLIIYGAILIYAFGLLFRELAHSRGSRRWQIKWVSITMLMAWIFGSTNWFLWFNIPIAPFPNFFVAPVFLLLTFVVIRRQLFDIDTLADIVQEARLSAVGLLAASIHHEIKNPLYVVKNLTESYMSNRKEGIYKEFSPEEREQKMEEIIQKTAGQIERVMEIMKRFSEFAKPRTGPSKAEPVSIQEIMDEALSLAQFKMQKIEVHLRLDKQFFIYADKKELNEIFLNLILNACEAMPGGGKLEISVRSINDKVQVEISDTGQGISRGIQHKIFEAFYTTKGEKGTGLGLYITKQLVERNGGKINVTSRAGNGTTVAISFPVVSGRKIGV